MSAERKAAWIREQREIAALVEILPNVVWPHHPTQASTSESSSKQFGLVSTARAMDSTNTFFGGVDISFPEDDEDLAVAVYTIVDAADDCMKVVYTDSEYFALTVPYVSSFLAFREIAPLVRLIDQQRNLRPEVTPRTILCDGECLLRHLVQFEMHS